MDAFEALRISTLCPFAGTSRVEYGPAWRRDVDFAQNVASIADALRHHLPRCRREQLRGFVAQVGVDDPGSFEGAVAAFRHLVFDLSDHDRSCRSVLTGDIGAREWNFKFAEEPIFLNLFASCYPQPHSKRINDPQHVYVFFQPEFTFDFCNVNRSRTVLKEQIRQGFTDAGMPYSGETIDGRRKALAYVFPLAVDDPPIEWWRPPNPSQSAPVSGEPTSRPL